MRCEVIYSVTPEQASFVSQVIGRNRNVANAQKTEDEQSTLDDIQRRLINPATDLTEFSLNDNQRTCLRDALHTFTLLMDPHLQITTVSEDEQQQAQRVIDML
jgi:hypothetical protein